jgi:formylglycine-generating enzyme
MRRTVYVVEICLVLVFTSFNSLQTIAAITIDTVPVGNPGNPADTVVMDDGTTGYGSVAYSYAIDKYDVTVGQYVAFLNAVAATDTYGLYNSYMTTDLESAGVKVAF